MPKFIVIDLFCGGGGTSLGFKRAMFGGKSIAEVIACVNHDEVAIRSHAANFPHCKHFTEDIRTLDVSKLPRKKPGDKRIWILWASLECTHFSNAKTGSREEDSRTLAHSLYPYIKHINPDLVQIENVREFKSWGPLTGKVVKSKTGNYCPLTWDKKKQRLCGTMVPVDRKKGIDYVKWRQNVEAMGYRYSSKMLNSADYGSHQSRNRYFAVFAKPEMPIVFPKPTHDERSRHGLKRWLPVREVLDLDKMGESIFGKKKPYVDNTLKRVLAGLIKFVPAGQREYLIKNYGGRPQDKAVSLDRSGPCITTVPHECLVQAQFVCQYNGGGSENNVFSTNRTCRTITTKDRFYLAQVTGWVDHANRNGQPTSLYTPALTVVTDPRQSVTTIQFVDNQFGTGVPSDIDEPSNTITVVNKKHLVTAFVNSQYGNSRGRSIEDPSPTLTTSEKHYVVSAAFMTATNYRNEPQSIEQPAPTITANGKWHYLINPQFGWPVVSTDAPCFTLIAKMDKRPPYLLSVEHDSGMLPMRYVSPKVYKNERIPVEARIRLFMRQYGIKDILMRAFQIVELKRIQGLGEDYILLGSKKHQKKCIGNAVVPHVVTKWIEDYYAELFAPVEQLSLFEF